MMAQGKLFDIFNSAFLPLEDLSCPFFGMIRSGLPQTFSFLSW